MAMTDKEEAALREALAEREAKLARQLRNCACASEVQATREAIERLRSELKEAR